jgi:hypothetical protein
MVSSQNQHGEMCSPPRCHSPARRTFILTTELPLNVTTKEPPSLEALLICPVHAHFVGQNRRWAHGSKRVMQFGGLCRRAGGAGMEPVAHSGEITPLEGCVSLRSVNLLRCIELHRPYEPELPQSPPNHSHGVS